MRADAAFFLGLTGTPDVRTFERTFTSDGANTSHIRNFSLKKEEVGSRVGRIRQGTFHEIYCAPILRIPFLPRIPAAPRRRSPDPLDLGVALGVRLLTVGLSSLGQQNERRGVALPPLPD